MITKERLEELIKEGATIYVPDDLWQTIGEIHLEKKCYISENNKLCNDEITYKDLPGAIAMYSIPLEELFETKEDARWELEMTATRTETLKLPTWKEFNKDNFGIKFYNKSREFCLHRVRYSASDKNPLWKIDLYESYGDDEDTVAWEKSWDLTKENYIEACKLCIKLFKGEER